jgi:fibronectin-binding autotransporter adhesin
MALPYTIDEQTKTITILSSMNLSILPPMDLATYSFVINSGATLTLDTVDPDVTIKDLSGGGNIELGNKTLTITNAANSTFSGVINNPYYNLSDITIDQNNIATINFAEPYSNIGVDTVVKVFNSGVSIFNNNYTILSMSETSATATPNWTRSSKDGLIYKIGDFEIPHWEFLYLLDIVIENNIATITFSPTDEPNPYTPIGVGEIVSVANSDVSIFNNTYTIISSSTTSATAVPNWILTSNGGSLASVEIADKNSLILSGGTLTLSGTNTYSGNTEIASGKLISTNISSLGNGVCVINTGATLDISGNNLSIIDLSGGGNIELGNKTLTITNAANSTFSGVINSEPSYNLSDIIIGEDGIYTINFAEPYSNIGVNTYVNVFNSSVSTFNTEYIVLSTSETSVTARGVSTAPISYGGSINKIDDEIIIPNYKLESIQMYGYLASITFAEVYDPIDVGKIVTVVNSGVSIFNNTYTIISSSETGAEATFNGILKSNGGSLGIAYTTSLVLSGGTLTLSGTNTYTGNTDIAGGKLIATNSSSLGNGVIYGVGGDLLFTNTFTFANQMYSPFQTTVSVKTGKTITFTNRIITRNQITIGDFDNRGSAIIYGTQIASLLTIYPGVVIGLDNVGTGGSLIVPTTAALEFSGTVQMSTDISGGGDVNVLNGSTSLSGNNKDLTGGNIAVRGELITSSNTALGSVKSVFVNSDSILDLSIFTPEEDFDVAPLNFISFAPQNFVSFAAQSTVRRTKIQLTLAPRAVVKAGVKKRL